MPRAPALATARLPLHACALPESIGRVHQSKVIAVAETRGFWSQENAQQQQHARDDYPCSPGTEEKDERPRFIRISVPASRSRPGELHRSCHGTYDIILPFGSFCIVVEATVCSIPFVLSVFVPLPS
jgi:hypothetical protein